MANRLNNRRCTDIRGRLQALQFVLVRKIADFKRMHGGAIPWRWEVKQHRLSLILSNYDAAYPPPRSRMRRTALFPRVPDEKLHPNDPVRASTSGLWMANASGMRRAAIRMADAHVVEPHEMPHEQ